jgi:hypothetical protein
MFQRKTNFLLATVILTPVVLVTLSSTVFRKPPELTITQPSGVETRLSSFKGKVLAIEFLFVRSQRCLRLVEILNKLNRELGSQGFQPIAVAFGPYADPVVLGHVMDYFKLTYPVGYVTADKVDAYLGREGKEILKVPQIVIVDCQGVIRAKSSPKGEPTLENESSLRALITTLLKDSARVCGKVQPPLDEKRQ